MKVGFYLPWICVFLESVHIWIGFAQYLVRNMLISFIIRLFFLPISSVICSELSKYYVSVILCTFIWKLKKKIFSFMVSYLICCLHVKHIILSSVPSWSSKTGPFLKWQRGLDHCHCNSKRLLPLYTTYEMEKFPSTLCTMNIQWLPLVVLRIMYTRFSSHWKKAATFFDGVGDDMN